MDLQEQIRKILQEETDFFKVVSRRITPERMEAEFQDSLNYVGKTFILNFKGNPNKLSKKEFTRMVGIDLIDGLYIRSMLPEDVEWYDGILKALTNHYKERISSMYNVLKK